MVVAGECDGSADGLYYVDDTSFAFCSNGQKTIQRCAEGSANPPNDHFKDGGYYGYFEFCSINLVAKGYPTASHATEPSYNDNDMSKKPEDAGYFEKDVGYYAEAPKAVVPAYTEEVHAMTGEGYAYKKQETTQ